jgi:hypothetical protein
MKVTEMNETVVSVDASNTLGIDNIATQQKVSALTSAQQSIEMRERIGRLSVEASVWESEAYANSNAILYGLLQKAYGLYLDLTNNADGNLKYRKQGLADYLSLNGLDSYKDKSLPQKIVVCVFGKRDRRRLSTYQLVLRYIIAQDWVLSEVPIKIAEAGGVQEISLGRPSGSLTTKEKAALAGARVSQEILATVHSAELSRQFNPEATGEQFAAVLTQEANGSFSVHCVVKSVTAVNSALAAYFAANKDDLKREVDEHQAAKTQASLAELNDAAASHKLAA